MASFTAYISHAEICLTVSFTIGDISELGNCEWPKPSAWPISCLVICSKRASSNSIPLDVFETEISTLSIKPFLSK